MFWIYLGIVIISVAILFTFLAMIILKMAFIKRGDNDPNLKYFTYLDFPELQAKPIEFKSGKNTLRGYIYSLYNSKSKKLIIFNHGFGAGHEAYTRLIRDLAIHNYFILAYDYTGCQLSEGKSMGSLSGPLKDFQAALDYVSQDSKLSKMDTYVLGHSWGGFVSAFALNQPNIKKVISIAPINSTLSGFLEQAPKLKFLLPFLFIANFLLFGRNANFTIKSRLKKTTTPYLMMGGSQDGVVKFENDFKNFQFISKDNPKVEYYLDKRKYHNPYLSIEGEKYLYTTFKRIKEIYHDKKVEENKAFFQSIDYDLITENDPDFLSLIIDFYNR